MSFIEQLGFFSLSAMSAWGFLMAFFFNIFVYCIDENKRKTTLLFSSFIMMLSYLGGDYFFNWITYTATTFLDWALYDLATLIFLAISFFVIKRTTPSFIYLIVGLIINTILFLAVYLDVEVYKNTTHWILWDIYSLGVNIVDFTMIIALIVDRDFLLLNKLKNAVFSASNTQSLA
ncbi:hypothetical protein E5N72_16180 [Pseudoalteromonas sp. MEBiC 03607]|jgi:hypothetical protein|uniref:hypothetical protein n=1 Tax=Pseudoalteromonas TaxID=53246 RepID=UPI000C37ED49|nr:MULTISPECIES: hypothetical protein [unclassified Pseudoalteromonas]MBU77142.1 hypothetical protein [Pseudoalteromonadaceae bacterium]HCV05574.1 hypothetical protein [Pseudoalteromonas sp.]MCF2901717.1 hypothetical protein [Pseudoalteromonas sp. OFAV1]MCF2921610.1 hypothetical protein [Pseudoalteromonas sp. APAL1]TGV21498.1 hypothetical protein E5N72_16180 [Pseudoalteromonas sp. MEBiC 03607]|tara:strand:+ start:944 stop:1471 length:528 start_codon:yes stop_codon:yes gene_type:complete